MKPIDCPFVCVLWLDAVTKHGWAEADDVSDKCDVEEVWSSGHMTFRDREQVKLTSDVGTDGGCNRRIAIPLGMIREIRAGSMDGELIYRRKTARRQKVESLGTRPKSTQSTSDTPKGSM